VKPVVDERQFNNFYINRPELDHTPNLGSYSPRNSDIALNHMTGNSYQIKISTITRKRNMRRFTLTIRPHPASSISRSKTIKKVDISLSQRGKKIFRALISTLNMLLRASVWPIHIKLVKF
jgi:hypothetical protein